MKSLASRLAALTATMVVTLSLMLGTPAQAATIDQQKALLEQELNDVSFFWVMYNNRFVEPYDDFDYTTDLCSWSPDRPLGFDFRDACRRHDFNYRNYKRLSIFTDAKGPWMNNSRDVGCGCGAHRGGAGWCVRGDGAALG